MIHQLGSMEPYGNQTIHKRSKTSNVLTNCTVSYKGLCFVHVSIDIVDGKLMLYAYRNTYLLIIMVLIRRKLEIANRKLHEHIQRVRLFLPTNMLQLWFTIIWFKYPISILGLSDININSMFMAQIRCMKLQIDSSASFLL